MSLTTRTGEDSGIPRGSSRRVLVFAGALALLVIVLAVVALESSPGLSGPPAGAELGSPHGDPLGYRPGRDTVLAQRAAAGSAQVLFTKSPGGAVATAARVARFRPLIDAAVQGTDIPANLLEGLVFLESAGRPDVVAGSSVNDAAGLTQILPGTAQSLLGMHVDLTRSAQLSAAIQRAQARGDARRVGRLYALLAQADQRFDPASALAGAVRYLEFAQRDLGRLDLSVVAYHAGVRNLQTVLGDYDGGRPVSYEQLYFDTAPNLHVTAWKLLSGLGDDSSLYLWRILGAERIMQLYRTQPQQLRRLAAQETGYPSDALSLVPNTAVRHFATPQALSNAYRSGVLVPLPRDPARLHLVYAASLGSLAHRVGAPAALYRGLRPAALNAVMEIAAIVHRLGGGDLTLTSTVLDLRYQRRFGYQDPPGATGFTFQILRHYSSSAQAQAFQFVLDRLQSLNLIAWIRGTASIEVTVAPDFTQVLRRGL